MSSEAPGSRLLPDALATGQPPLVSVVIPTYNGARYLGAAIESVLGQTHPCLEVLVVDDGATDGTPDVAAGYGPRVRLLRQANAGTAAARNTGVAHARGEFIALLDHDDLWEPRKLECQLPLFADDPAIGAVFAGIEFFRAETGEVTAGYFPGLELDAHDLLAHRVLPIQTVIFRRAALAAVGPFDAALRGTDDWDMGIRLAARFRVVGLPETLARVRLHPGQQGSDTPRMYLHAARVLRKHRSLHPGCRACREARAASWSLLRADLAGARKLQAHRALSEGRYGAAARNAVAATWLDPAALPRALGRALTRPHLTPPSTAQP